VRRPAFAVAIVVLGALLFSSGAQACSCIKRTPRQALREADAAVVARLVKVVPANSYSAQYHYLVRRAYKRGTGIQAGETISVRSGVNGASCGFPVDKDRWYGLFLYRSGNRWTGGLCGLVAPRQLSAAASALHKGDDLAAAAGSSCAS
jgi:hypothetical protein